MSKSKTFSKKVIDLLLETDNHQCHYCGNPVFWWTAFIPEHLEDGAIVAEAGIYQRTPDVIVTGTTAGDPPRAFRLVYPNNQRIASIDHKVPRSKGGTHDLSNLVIACLECNNHKHASITYEAFKALKQGGGA